MSNNVEEIEEVLFQALAHPTRRSLLKILGTDAHGVSYTELINELGLPTGKLNYHLEQLAGLIEKNAERHYVLTSLGRKALSQTQLVEQGISKEDERYVRLAEKVQRSSLEPTLKSFLLVGLAASLMVLAVLGVLVYVALTESSVPTVMFVLLPIFIALEVAIIASLVRALLKAPAWLRRLERRFFID